MSLRRYHAVFQPARAQPPFVLWLIEIEGHSAEDALKANLERVTASARAVCLDYFGAEIFSREELLSQIRVIPGE